MAADFSRVRHHPFFDWAGVELKQGGVLLDADANELVAVIDRRLRALAGDVLGRARVSSTTPDAFRIAAAGGGLSIGPGRLYVDGLLAENHGGGALRFDALMAEPAHSDPLGYAAQHYLPAPPALPTAGRHLVYLDVWQREVTHLEMPELVESAVGVETSSRLQTVWQVRVLADDAGSASTCATADADLPGWAALIAPSDGRLSTGTFDLPPLADPCELPPSGGYRGLENQLYRVEIHDPGLPGAGATFKWSRDNASVGSRVAAVVSATQLELETLGRDDVLCFADQQWVEITDDVREFAQAAGEMRRITVDVATRRVSFTPALPAAMVAAGFAQRHLRVRRWDQSGRVFRTGPGSNTTQVQDLDAAASTGVIAVPAAGTTLLLEHGITVSFASAGARGFRAGDWWVFAARTADASVEPLADAPPRGIHHHYARLGLWDVAAGTVTDCRLPWPPDTQGTDCACTQCVTPQSHASGRLTIQAAVDRVRDSGGTVCLHAGTYALDAPVRVVNARSVSIRGQGPASVIAAPGAAFEVETSLAVAIEKLAVVSLGRASAIGLRTVAGVRLAELAIAVLGGNDFRSAAVALAGVCAGVTIRDDFVIAPDGIRAETSRAGRAPFVLAAALAIEDNVLWCQRAGIVLDGPVAHMLGTRVRGNELLGCREGGVSTRGFALPGASVRVEANGLNVNGPGIACGTDGTWIEGNKLVAARQGQRAPSGAAITLATGLDPNGSDQAQVLANQVRGFAGAAVSVLAPTAELIVKLNIVEDCGLGIVMSDDAEAGAVSIENNHLRDIRGEPERRGIVAGIAVTRTEAATIAGNTIRRVATAAPRGTLIAGVLTLGVLRARVSGNEIVEIAPAADFAGIGAGIMVRAPCRQAELHHNHVARDAGGQAGGLESSWIAAMVEDQSSGAAAGVAGIGAVAGVAAAAAPASAAPSRTAGITTLRLDDRRTLVLAADRAFIGLADLVLDAAGAAVARGANVSLLGNRFTSRGRLSAVIVAAGGDTMFSDNRCEYRGGRSAVQITSPAVIVNANRVVCDEFAITILGSKSAAVLGNVTTHGIAVNGGPLPADWLKFNLLG